MMTVEEARHRAGLGPKKEADTLYPPSNMTAPAGSLGKEKEQEDA
jgi:hypothetical protein